MSTSLLRFAIVCTLLTRSVAASFGATIEIPILDIGTFIDLNVSNSGQSFAGAGFVGVTPDGFGHFFGHDQTRRTSLQVDISSLHGASIDLAILSFRLFEGFSGTSSVFVTSYSADGTMEHFWNPPDNLGTLSVPITGLGSQNIFVGGYLQERLDGGHDWLGLHLSGVVFGQWTTTFSSDDAQVRLVVQYSAAVPEPSACVLALLATGGMALGLAGRLAHVGKAYQVATVET